MVLILNHQKNDKPDFVCIINGSSYEEIEKNLTLNKNGQMFQNFKETYIELDSKYHNGKELFNDFFLNGLQLLTVVEISLESSENAQEIFESINSLGVDLTNAELIRNYLLMKRSYGINDRDVYKEFVKYSKEISTDDIREFMLKDLKHVAEVFQPFLSINQNNTTNKLMQELRDMDQTTVYPFLLHVFLDKKIGLIDEMTLNQVINLMIVYLFRRKICKRPTNSLRGFLLSLYNRVFKVKENKNRYFKSIYAFLSNIKTNDSLLSREEVKKNLALFSLYAEGN